MPGKKHQRFFILVFIFILISTSVFAEKHRMAIVDSYSVDYMWSLGTAEGVNKGLLEYNYLDNNEQADTLNKTHYVESSASVIKKFWMDSKKNNSQIEIAESMDRITRQLEEFQPTIVLLGDDNAANYIGNYYLDTETPVVFWGVNGSPLKYGLIDSIENPGHNVTGIYQKSYHKEGIEHLLKLVPNIKRIAVLSDDSTTGRAHTKSFIASLQKGLLQTEAVKIVQTNSYETWKQEILNLKNEVDAFLVSTHATFKDKEGKAIKTTEAAAWYLKNVSLPEAVTSIAFIKEGMLAAINDSPQKQGYEAIRVSHQILSEGKKPADIQPYAPEHGGFTVNQWRAERLGLADKVDKHRAIIKEIITEHVDIK